MAWLDAHQPADRPHVLIHNDFRFDNLVLDPDDPTRIVGVLDWEMATVGDPLMDLGSALAYWVQADDHPAFLAVRRQPTHAPGMLTRAEVVRALRRRARAGGDPEQWRFYDVFGAFRLAVIAQQIYYRFHHGQTSNPAYGEFREVVRFLDHALHRRSLARDRPDHDERTPMPTTLITGASSGLGAEMARQFADRGWDLALAARRTERLEGLRDEILAAHPGRRVELRALDVTDDDQVFEVFRAFRDDFGTIDRVIVNAGLGKGAPLGTGRYDANRQTAMTNFVAALAQTEAAMEIFRAQKRGHLVMISSISAMRGMRKTVTTYAATKAGVATLAEGLRNEMLGEPDLDIRVSTIYPGYIRSEMNEQVKKTPFIVDTETGVRAIVEAIEKEKANALVPAWPWVPLGHGDAPPAAAPRPEDHLTVARVLVTAQLPGTARRGSPRPATTSPTATSLPRCRATSCSPRSRASTRSSPCWSTGSTRSCSMPPGPGCGSSPTSSWATTTSTSPPAPSGAWS